MNRDSTEKEECRSADDLFISTMENTDIVDTMQEALSWLKAIPGGKVKWDTVRLDYSPWESSGDLMPCRYDVQLLLNGHFSPPNNKDMCEKIFLHAKVQATRGITSAACSIEGKVEFSSKPFFRGMGDAFADDSSVDCKYAEHYLAFNYKPVDRKKSDDLFSLSEIFTEDRLTEQVRVVIHFLADTLKSYLSGDIGLSSKKVFNFLYYDEDEDEGEEDEV